MKKSNALNIIGFRHSEIICRKLFTDIDHGKRYVDGHELDTIHIECALYTPDDVNSLIALLKIARESLHTQGINHGSNEMDLKSQP